MSMLANRVLLVGHFGIGTLAQSYKAAFEGAGCEIYCFDMNSAVEKYCRFGRLGRKFNSFVPVEAWTRKANREMVVLARKFTPKVIVVVGSCPVTAGALAQIKSALDV